MGMLKTVVHLFPRHYNHIIFKTKRYAVTSRRRSKIYIETYGCLMNHNDKDIAKSLLYAAGYQEVSTAEQSGTVLLFTCAIRESAEAKIWGRLKSLRSFSDKNKLDLKIGVLGCMAERLKERLLTPSSVQPGTSFAGADFVCGPDAYRDLPQLLQDAHAGLQGASVALSLEETYADVTPVRKCSTNSCTHNSPTALLSVMRGCNNMCTYCIVPFVRGRERSRPLKSILDETRRLVDEGVREVTLLGQNVNSYCDRSQNSERTVESNSGNALTPGFRTVYRLKEGGLRFADLLDQMSQISPELRIRFTSPHPKDFPAEVIKLIAERENICSQLHLPAQSGSEAVLDRMRRNYSPEAYMQLVDTVQRLIPNVAITSDFIAGFCGETEEDHEKSVALIKRVNYAYTFCYPFSMREKTKAYHRLDDDVPDEVKRRRHLELKSAGREAGLRYNDAQIGRVQLILIEGTSRRSPEYLYGRNDGNIKVICPKISQIGNHGEKIVLEPGDYVAVRIHQATSQTLHGHVLEKCTAQEFHRKHASMFQTNDFDNFVTRDQM